MGNAFDKMDENYDTMTDTMYVSFSDEPHYAEEIDDMLILELGIYSNMPVGFCILNFSKNKMTPVKKLFERINHQIAEEKKKQEVCFDKSAKALNEGVQKVLTAA